MLVGVRAAFPQEKIVFFGEASHIVALKELFAFEDVDMCGLAFEPIRIEAREGLAPILKNLRILSIVFNFALELNATQVLFTAVSSSVMTAVNILKRRRVYRTLKCLYVMHGILESLGPKVDGFSAGDGAEPQTEREQVAIVDNGTFQRLASKLRSPGAWRLIGRLFLLSSKRIGLWILRTEMRLSEGIYAATVGAWLGRKLLNFRFLLENLDSSWGGIILLSPHISKNLSRFAHTDRLRQYVVVMPYLFSRYAKCKRDHERRRQSEITRFAVIGKGHPGRLREVAARLSHEPPRGGFEIAAYTMNNPGFDRYPAIRTFGQGKRVSREIIKVDACEVDFFLFLYDEREYYLSCSAAFFEVFSNGVPFLSLPCECIDYFNRPEKEIGLKCSSIPDMTSLMRRIVDDPEFCFTERQRLRENILKMRAAIDIEKNTEPLRDAFEWTEMRPNLALLEK